MNKIKIYKGDITKLQVDAIVNAANSSLLGGGGVDGAIHRVGGSEILNACISIRKRIGKCKVGDAVITTAGNLPAKFVIHIVGPIWYGGKNGEEQLLSNCYRNSLELAIKNNVKTISFPNISTGAYRFPKERAAVIAINTVKEIIHIDEMITEVTFVCFDDENFSTYHELINNNSK
jgi:O-acetyl-ADP-ribose deacetylase